MKALKIDDRDNVATALFEIESGSKVEIVGTNNTEGNGITVSSTIPKGHKIALLDIEKGKNVIKYGEVIGIAIDNIKKGDLVHSHNLDSIRGRVNEEQK